MSRFMDRFKKNSKRIKLGTGDGTVGSRAYHEKYNQELIEKTEKSAEKIAKEKERKIREYRQEVSRRASMANKRLKRLEQSGMDTSPAYQKWKEDGGEYFSIRGKSYNEVQSEMARINQYLDSITSTVTGSKKVLNNLIDVTGMDIDFTDFKDVQSKTKTFFDLASRIEQYLRTVEDRASAVRYEKIWQAINRYVQESETSLDNAESDIEGTTHAIVQAMKEWEEKEEITDDLYGYELTRWYKLDKD